PRPRRDPAPALRRRRGRGRPGRPGGRRGRPPGARPRGRRRALLGLPAHCRPAAAARSRVGVRRAHPVVVGGALRRRVGRRVPAVAALVDLGRSLMGTAPATGRGFGRLLVTVYGILAFAATGRSAYQVATKPDEAPAAYLLSLLAAALYVVATVALARGGRGRWRTVAWCAVLVEASGVVLVGALSAVVPELFVEATVWSGFGQGYGYVPL